MIVELRASKRYEILIDELCLDDLGRLARRVCGGDSALIVSDSKVAPLYLDRARASLEKAGYACADFVVPEGEASKSLASFSAALDACAAAGLTRSSLIVALGGGVVGDLAGFVAASYMRGCRLLQVPTTLLACVDSSVGGKCGVNLDAGKNLAGAFFHPDAVLIDTSLLASLDARVFTDGCAEMLKCGAIRDPELFFEMRQVLRPGDARLPGLIARCAGIKRDVVEADEGEGGLRRILNFGHSVGHAIERLSDYRVSHGFAVASGMAVVSRAAWRAGRASADFVQDLEELLEAYGFDPRPRFDASALAAAALSDKKRSGSVLPFVIVPHPGRAEMLELGIDELEAFIASGLEGRD